MRTSIAAAAFLLFATAVAPAAEQFTFDAAEFEKKPFEFGGYLELRYDHFRLNSDGAFYQLNYLNDRRATLDRYTAILKPTAKFTQGIYSAGFRAHLEHQDDQVSEARQTRFDELTLSAKPEPGFTLDAGKTAMKWGKGYAWNPVGFIERLKDPNDPELAREGFGMLSADLIRNFDGPLKTVAFTPVVLPVTSSFNQDFGGSGHTNVAGKLYLLYHDTDIDFLFLSNGSRSQRFGIDFSRNMTSNLELHGEWAYIKDAQTPRADSTGRVTTTRSDAHSHLIGLRYLSAADTTYILEYYRNGLGYTEAEMQRFFDLVDSGTLQLQNTGSSPLLERALPLSRSAYGRPNPGRHYLYLRASQKEPFDILYLVPAITFIANTDDRSYSVTPEVVYTGFTNVELRARAFILDGKPKTEFGEKQNRQRLELMLRLYF